MRAFVRQPFAVIGALSLISLLSNILDLQQDLQRIIHAIQTVTHWIWDVIFGWTNLNVAGWIKDYLTMGVIVAGMTLRMRLNRWHVINMEATGSLRLRILTFPFFWIQKGQWFRFYFIDLPIRMLDIFLFWPVHLLYRAIQFTRIIRSPEENLARLGAEPKGPWLESYAVFLETFVWALVILVGSYAVAWG